MGFEYDIFLCHNSVDKGQVTCIARKLVGAGLKPWLDDWYVVPGRAIQHTLDDVLRSSANFAIFVGQSGLGNWEREELLVAQDRAAKESGVGLIPVLLPGVSDPFDFSRLPRFLTQRAWIDFRRGLDEPRPLQKLINAIKGLPPGPDVAGAPDDQRCPYRGLEVFEKEHTEFFLGREPDVQRLLEKLKSTRFLAVLGASGSGKSSLVRAGLIPALKGGALSQSETWKISVLKPGSRPLTTLAAHLLYLCPEQPAMQRTVDLLTEDERTLHHAVALSLVERNGGCIVWVIDQFEEVFTLCSDAIERAQFLANLLYASSIPDGRCTVLLTMRADFLPKCAALPGLAEQIAAHQFLVSVMDENRLRQAIEEPARRVGLAFEPGLVDNILNDIASEPGALPLLEHALLELWKRRDGGRLTLDGYGKSGGVKGAIAATAEETFGRLSPSEQRIVRRIMLRLTQIGEGTEDTRRRTTVDELMTAPEEADAVERIVSAMADARLFTTSGE